MSRLFFAVRLAALLLVLPAVQAFADTSYFHKDFAGKIGDRYGFTMNLKNVDGELSGTYRYTGKRQDVYLKGRIDPSGAFTMNERMLDGKQTGTFTGKLAGTAISGVWRSGDGAKSFPFDAHQTSEIVIGTKHDILTQAVGRYTLDTISGAAGANGMSDTWKEKGKWKSSESSLSGGTREGGFIALKPSDIRLLDSMAVTVEPNLTVRFSAGGKDLLTIPYRNAGMQYELNGSHSSTVDDGLKALSADTTVHDEHLYLLARDGIDYSGTINGNFEATTADIVIVSFSPIEKTFDVTFKQGSCCDNTTFTFRRATP